MSARIRERTEDVYEDIHGIIIHSVDWTIPSTQEDKESHPSIFRRNIQGISSIR